MSPINHELSAELMVARELSHGVRREVKKLMRGQDRLIDYVTVALFARGHGVLTSVPGLGKTMLCSGFGTALYKEEDGKPVRVDARLQCTPDMANPCGIWFKDPETQQMRAYPTEILKKHFVLADELNRTPPKTQAPLLEAMEEWRVTMRFGGFKEIVTTPTPWSVFATQNPIEQEGTYPLPEAQLDRFLFELVVSYPGADAEKEVALDNNLTSFDPTKVIKPVLNVADLLRYQELVRALPVSDEVADYAVRLVRATRPGQPEFNPHLTVPRRGGGTLTLAQVIGTGASVRGSQALIKAARAIAVVLGTEETVQVTKEHVQLAADPVLRHRMFMTPTGSRVDRTDVVKALVSSVPLDRPTGVPAMTVEHDEAQLPSPRTARRSWGIFRRWF